MNQNYRDIISKIDITPLWFDEHGVPRYCDFAPRHLANIYAVECVLMRVSCQGCAMQFLVAMSGSHAERLIDRSPLLWELIEAMTIHYGDPPNVACCPAGPTMNSVPRQVIEYWRRRTSSEPAACADDRLMVWKRDPAFDRRDIVPDWWDEPEEEST